MRNHFLLVLALLALPAAAAEHKFDFSEVREGQAPPAFRSAVTGQGQPGDWRVLMDDVPPLLQPITPGAQTVAKRAVLAQVAQDPTDEHFPLLIYEGENIDDFTFTTRFKTVRGVVERMAGVAFRIQNETNYYVVRASSIGNNFRFYKVLNGHRGPLVGPEVPIPSGIWHDLTVECKGNTIRCLLNGKELITATDNINPFTSGKVGFWTKSDAVSYFADATLVYKRHQPPAQGLVREVLKKYPRLLGLQVLRAGYHLEGAAPVGQQGHQRGEPGRRQSRTGRAGSGLDLLWEGEGLGLRGDAAAGPERRPRGRCARDHDDLSRRNRAERHGPSHADRQGHAEPLHDAAGPGPVAREGCAVPGAPRERDLPVQDSGRVISPGAGVVLGASPAGFAGLEGGTSREVGRRTPPVTRTRPSLSGASRGRLSR